MRGARLTAIVQIMDTYPHILDAIGADAVGGLVEAPG